MAVSLEKSKSEVREYTPEHLMDEEEAVRTFCPRRENPEEPEILVTTEKEDLPAEKSEVETKADKAFKILLLIICIWIFAFGVGMLIFTVFNAVDGLRDVWAIVDRTARLEALRSVLRTMIIQGLCSASFIAIPLPRLIQEVQNAR